MLSLQLGKIHENHCAYIARGALVTESQSRLIHIIDALESGIRTKEEINHLIRLLPKEDRDYICLGVRVCEYRKNIVDDETIMAKIFDNPMCLLKIYHRGKNFILSRIQAPFYDLAIRQMKWEVTHLKLYKDRMVFEDVYFPLLVSLRLIKETEEEVQIELVTLIQKFFGNHEFYTEYELRVCEPKIEFQKIISTLYSDSDEARWQLVQSFLHLGHYSFVVNHIREFDIRDEGQKLILIKILIDRGEDFYVAQFFKDFAISTESNRIEAFKYLCTKTDLMEEIIEYFSEFDITEANRGQVMDFLIDKGYGDDIAINFEHFGVTKERQRIWFLNILLKKQKFSEVIKVFEYFQIRSGDKRARILENLIMFAERKRGLEGDLSLWQLIIENFENFQIENQESKKSILIKILSEKICLNELAENFNLFSIEDEKFRLFAFSFLIESGDSINIEMLASNIDAFAIEDVEQRIGIVRTFIDRREFKVTEAIIIHLGSYLIEPEELLIEVVEYIIHNATPELLRLLAQNFCYYSIKESSYLAGKFDFFFRNGVFKTVSELEEGFKNFKIREPSKQIDYTGQFFTKKPSA